LFCFFLTFKRKIWVNTGATVNSNSPTTHVSHFFFCDWLSLQFTLYEEERCFWYVFGVCNKLWCRWTVFIGNFYGLQMLMCWNLFFVLRPRELYNGLFFYLGSYGVSLHRLALLN
jgi:hypothetical protein